MDWIRSLFGVDKPIIGMCHLRALPGDPGYDADKGLDWVYDQAAADLEALQSGGVDAVLFSNEFSRPYLTEVEPVTVACMASLIARLKPAIKIPFGVDVLWDAKAALDLAIATGAQFVREVFTGVYGSDFGLWNTHCGEVIRHQHRIGAENVRLFFNIVPEAAAYLGDRSIADIAYSTVFNTLPDALCVSGITAGRRVSSDTLRIVKEIVPEVPVFANTGVNLENITEQLDIADGAVVGTAFKKDRVTWNPVERDRVQELMTIVRSLRGE
ncbi:MAG TPA: BtpA/SgcQ family protein [Chloroflexi bacterium]|nr:BtpA/SgcQ family protein [Chloroflexota bacterium]